jgi:hypothetical protein
VRRRVMDVSPRGRFVIRKTVNPLSPTRIDHTDKEGLPSVCLRLCLFGSLCVSVLRLCEFMDTPIGLTLLVYEALSY